MPAFEARATQADGCARLELRGELDLLTRDRAEEALRALEADEPKVLLLDLKGLTFLGSEGVEIALGAESRARDGGWQLMIVPGPPAVQRPFEIFGLDARLEWVDGGATREEGPTPVAPVSPAPEG